MAAFSDKEDKVDEGVTGVDAPAIEEAKDLQKEGGKDAKTGQAHGQGQHKGGEKGGGRKKKGKK